MSWACESICAIVLNDLLATSSSGSGVLYCCDQLYNILEAFFYNTTCIFENGQIQKYLHDNCGSANVLTSSSLRDAFGQWLTVALVAQWLWHCTAQLRFPASAVLKGALQHVLSKIRKRCKSVVEAPKNTWAKYSSTAHVLEFSQLEIALSSIDKWRHQLKNHSSQPLYQLLADLSMTHLVVTWAATGGRDVSTFVRLIALKSCVFEDKKKKGKVLKVMRHAFFFSPCHPTLLIF